MNRRHRKLSGPVLICALIAATSGAVHAHDVESHPAYRHGGGWRGAAFDGAAPGEGGRFVDAMAARLELTVEQQDAIRDLMVRSRPAIRELRDAQRANRRELMETPTDAADYDVVLQRVAETNGQLTTDMIRRHGQLRAEVHALLTPEQRERALAMKQALRERLEYHLEQRFADGHEILF